MNGDRICETTLLSLIESQMVQAVEQSTLKTKLVIGFVRRATAGIVRASNVR